MHTTDTSWLRVKEVAYKLGLSEQTIRRHIKAGDIPAKQLGSRSTLLVPRDFLDDLDGGEEDDD